MNRGRIQAQDNNLEKSEAWATEDEINKTNATSKTNSLKHQLTRKELDERIRAFDKVEYFIQNAPPEGYYSQLIKSFHHNPQNRRVRVDIEIREGRAFID